MRSVWPLNCQIMADELTTTMLIGSAPASTSMVAEVVALSAADEARALGDTLPVGLTLVG